MNNDGTVIFDKPDSSNSFYIKRKDGKGYDLYVKHEDAFINAGIIENPEDYKEIDPICINCENKFLRIFGLSLIRSHLFSMFKIVPS